MITGWEFMTGNVMTIAGFTLLNPVGAIMTILISFSLAQNTKKAIIASFPVTLALGSAGMNPGLIIQVVSAFGFLFMGFSLTTLGSNITSAFSGLREETWGQRVDKRKEQEDWDMKNLRSRKEWEWRGERGYQLGEARKDDKVMKEIDAKITNIILEGEKTPGMLDKLFRQKNELELRNK